MILLLAGFVLSLSWCSTAQVCSSVNLQLPAHHVRSMCGPVQSLLQQAKVTEASFNLIKKDQTDIKKRVADLENEVMKLSNLTSDLSCSRDQLHRVTRVMEEFIQQFYVNGTYKPPACHHSITPPHVRQPNLNTGLPRDCWDVYTSGRTQPGAYKVHAEGMPSPVSVWCEAGWTVIQRRTDGKLDFNQYWENYVTGFGKISGEHWVGSDLIHFISNQEQTTLRLEMKGFTDKLYWAQYNNFTLGPEGDYYRLHISGYSGNYKDGFAKINGIRFSTKDDDHDNAYSTNCADKYGGAWWLDNCGWSINRAICNHKSGCALYYDRYVKSTLMKIIPTAALGSKT